MKRQANSMSLAQSQEMAGATTTTLTPIALGSHMRWHQESRVKRNITKVTKALSEAVQKNKYSNSHGSRDSIDSIDSKWNLMQSQNLDALRKLYNQALIVIALWNPAEQFNITSWAPWLAMNFITFLLCLWPSTLATIQHAFKRDESNTKKYELLTIIITIII